MPIRETGDNHNSPLSPGPEGSYSPLSTRPSLQQHYASPKASGACNRRATTAFSEQREKRPLQTYGTKASQDTTKFYRHSDDEGDTRSCRKPNSNLKLGMAVRGHLNREESLFIADDVAASRVEAMLNNYHGAEDLLTGNLSLGSFPSIQTSIQTSTTPKTPKPTDVHGPVKSQHIIMPAVQDTTPVASIEAHTAGSMEVNASNDTMTDPTLSSHTPKEAHGPAHNDRVREDSRKRPRTELENSDGENDDSMPLESQASARSAAREKSTDLYDELASTASKTPASRVKRKPSKTSKGTEVEYTKHADELGSDEIAVGLPKEQYQPRPSRSRSNRNDEELINPEDFSKRPEVVAKKKASKRRKTTALAKPSPKVEVEDEAEEDEDIIRLSTRTTQGVKSDVKPVVLIPGAEIEPERQEAGDTKEAGAPIEDEEPSQGVPTQEKASPGSPPKKRRGRPRKQTAEPAVDVPNDHDEDLPNLQELTKTSSTQKGRKKRKIDTTPAIHDDHADASDNAIIAPTEDDEPDLHLSQTEGNSRPPVPTSTTTTTTKEANPGPISPAKLTTPPKTPQKLAQSASAAKGPDKHSPLNSGKVKFRVGLSKRARIEPLLKVVKK